MKYFVADVGGTNIRLALLDENGQPTQVQRYLCASYATIDNVIKLYFEEQQVKPEAGCIAVACPVDTDQITMTNHSWSFSVKALTESLSLRKLHMLNDFSAVAMSLPAISELNKIKVGTGEINPTQPAVVLGPGTGLGVAHLANIDGQWVPLSGEGGHVDFAPIDDVEFHLLQFVRKKHSRVSMERMLSGNGLLNIYQGLADYRNAEAVHQTPAQVCDAALNQSCAVSEEALHRFCAILGGFAGNLALNMNTGGGVYIAGGIIPRFASFFAASDFRKRFEDKGRFKAHMQGVASYLITEAEPGLLGAAQYLSQLEKVTK